jgi:hypothetical protein
MGMGFRLQADRRVAVIKAVAKVFENFTTFPVVSE